MVGGLLGDNGPGTGAPYRRLLAGTTIDLDTERAAEL